MKVPGYGGQALEVVPGLIMILVYPLEVWRAGSPFG